MSSDEEDTYEPPTNFSRLSLPKSQIETRSRSRKRSEAKSKPNTEKSGFRISRCAKHKPQARKANTHAPIKHTPGEHLLPQPDLLTWNLTQIPDTLVTDKGIAYLTTTEEGDTVYYRPLGLFQDSEEDEPEVLDLAEAYFASSIRRNALFPTFDFPEDSDEEQTEVVYMDVDDQEAV